jgi:ABC-2 type transport system permease protein
MFSEVLKYRRHLTIGYQTRMEHRFSVFCSIAVFMFPVVAKIIFWKAVYVNGQGDIGGFNISDMIMYILIFQFVFEFTWCYPGEWIVRPNIIQGGLTDYLRRPVSYLLTLLFRVTGNMFPRWTSTLGIFVFLFVLFSADIKLSTSLWIYPAGMLAIVLCYFLLFFYSFLIGLIAFWTEGDIPFLGHIYRLFSGWIVPLAFLPIWVRSIADVLPFKYMIYFPTTILMGKLTLQDFIRGVSFQVFWIILFLVAINFIWKRGVRRYEAYGG